jgi:hypothetical protein
MTVGFALGSVLAAAIAERSVTTPAPGLKVSVVLLTLIILGANIGAMFGLAGLEDALRVYLRDAPISITSIISDHAMFLFIVTPN